MPEMLYLRRYEVSVYVIPYDHYHVDGIRDAIFDINDILANHGAPADDQAVELFERLHQIGMDTCPLSNNKEPRVRHFADKVGSAYIYKTGKPKRGDYEQAVERMGMDRETTIPVRSQLFTDIYGASRTGTYSILVGPTNPKEEMQVVLKRYLEKPVSYLYKGQYRRKA